MAFKVFPCEMKVPCDTFQCYNRAVLFVGREDAPKNLLTKICDKCANELKESVIQLIESEVKSLEASQSAIVKDAESASLAFIEQLEQEKETEVNATEGVSPAEEIEVMTIDGKAITDMSVRELKEICKEYEIPKYSELNKDDLVKLVDEFFDNYQGEE